MFEPHIEIHYTMPKRSMVLTNVNSFDSVLFSVSGGMSHGFWPRRIVYAQWVILNIITIKSVKWFHYSRGFWDPACASCIWTG